MTPTKEINKEEAREAAKALEEKCEHSTLFGYCLEYNEMCYYEEQTLCPDYPLKYINIEDKK